MTKEYTTKSAGKLVLDDDDVVAVMEGVRNYDEDTPFLSTKVLEDGSKRLTICAPTEGGYNCTDIDLLDLLDWVKKNRPELWDQA
jgi:hypothetical protein